MSARKVVTSFGLVASLFAVSFAHANDKAKKGKTVGDILRRIEANTKKVQFSKSRAALPTVQKSAAHVAPVHENLSQVKPPARSSMYYEEGTNEAELEKITNQGIDQLYKLTRQFRNSKRRGELWLRLAELYVEKSRLIEYRLQQRYDAAIHDFQTGKTKTKPALNLSASQEYNKKAIELYEWFLRDFPKDPKIDQALFFLGYNYFELNQAEKGKGYYQRLTVEHPNSNYVEESNFALAEYYFDREKWSEALKYYTVVANNKRSRLYSFALYKQAWCEYKVGRTKEALASLERVIRAGRLAKGSQDSSAAGAGRIRLATEAQKDLVVFYAEVGTPQNAHSYFEEIAGEKQTFNLMEKLAYYYVDTGNRDGARYLFRELITEKPNSPKAYDYQYQIVQLYTSSDKGEVYKQELYNWIHTYAPDSDWAKANAGDKELIAKAQQLIETTLRNRTLQAHQTAQNSHVPSAQRAAREGYELYFQTFKEGPHLDEMHFFYAELLFDMGDFKTASFHYNWIVEHSPKSKYYEKSLQNTVLALEKSLPKEEELKKQTEGKTDPIPFSDNIKAFQVAAERYIAAYPKGENVPAIRYKIGALYYYHNQFDQALAQFNGIIHDYPKSQYAKYSANLTLDIFNLKKDFGGLEKAGQDILANQDLAKSEVGEQVKDVLRRAGFKKAQNLEDKKDYAGAAKAYEEFAAKNAGTTLGSSAAFNSAVDYEKSGDVAKAIQMYGVVIRGAGSKDAKLAKDSQRFLAPLYQKTGQYQRAAEAFEAYARKYEKDKEAASFFFNAALIRDGMNSYVQAIADYDHYMGMVRGPDKQSTVLLEARLYDRRGNLTKALDLYKQYYEGGNRGNAETVEVAFRMAQIFAAKHRTQDAEDYYKKTIWQQKRLSTEKNLIGVSEAAESKYILVAKTYDELRALKIPQNPARQKAILNQKIALLDKLKNQLKEVIKYDDGPMVVASLTLIGQAYQHMSASIYAVPLPKGLDDAGMKQYKAGIDGVAKPFTDQAIQNYALAIERGFKLEGYNESLKVAQHELSRLNKEKYPDYGEKAVSVKMPDLMGVDSDPQLGQIWKAQDEKMLVDAVVPILGKDENDLKALSALAAFYLQQGKNGMARIIITRAQKTHATEPGLTNNVGVIELSEGKQRLAIASFRKAVAMNKGYPIGSANLGSIFVEYKDYAKAADLLEDAFNAVKSDLHRGVNLDIANNYALAMSGSGKQDDAKDVFDQILKADNQNVTALLNYAILLIEKIKDKDAGRKVLDRVKFLADDAASKKRVEELDKTLNEKN